MKKFLFSITATILVSGLFGLLFSSWIVFLIASILQFLIFGSFNTLYENYLRQKAIKMQLDMDLVNSKSNVKLNCPSCNHVQEVKMTFEGAVVYKCEKCDVEIKAEPVVKNYLTTNPIYFDK